MSVSIKVNIGEVLMNGMMDVISKVVMDLSVMYNFDGEEACRMLEIGKSVSKSKVKEVSKSVSVVKQVKSLIALPFNGDRDMSCCQGLRQNHGLYTQCQGRRKDSGEFCKVCQSQADKNENGKPEYGTIGDRMNAHDEGVEFKDPSGKCPTAYSIVMKKLKLTREQVEAEAGKLNIKLNPIHFEEVATKKSGRPAKAEKKEKTETKPKGRPKKSKKVLELAGEEEDLFASLVMCANAESNAESNGLNTPILADSDDEEKSSQEPIEEPIEKPIEESSEKPIKKQKKNKISEEEKQAMEDEKALAKQKKKALEDEKAAKKKALEDEKAAKKKAIEDEKEAKKKAIEDEKAAKKKVSEEEKPAQKKKSSTKESKKATTEEEEPDVVKKIEFEGKKYLKSKNSGIIYNMEQDVIGKWNEEKQRIEFNEVAEESEDEYDDDN